jgi:aspartate/methionine/tyrosine aminotransferase
MPLREAIAEWYGAALHVEVDPARVVVTAGSSAALLLALAATVNPGDEVLMGDPTYPCNRHFVSTLGGLPRLLPTDARSHFQLTAAQIDQAWHDRTRAVIIASPANPTGSVVSLAMWQAIGESVTRHQGHLIGDEIYQGLTFDQPPTTVLSAVPNAWVINSFSKYFQMTGWRLGWLIAPPGLTRVIETLAQNLYISPSAPAQYAALAAFAPETIAILEARRTELAARRDYLLGALPALGFRVDAKPAGAFYIYCDVSSRTDDAFAFARQILDEAHVALTPGKDFGVVAPERFVRIAYTQPIARLQEAVERLGRLKATP